MVHRTGGGRTSGPPTAAVYAATAVFPLGGEQEVTPGWPGSADQVSILVQRIRTLPSGEYLAKIGFLVPELAQPHLRPGVTILILEGPRTVARAVVREVPAQDC